MSNPKIDKFIIEGKIDINSIIPQSFPQDDLKEECPHQNEFNQKNNNMSDYEDNDFKIIDNYSTKNLLDMENNPFIISKEVNFPCVKEENIKGIFHLFTKRSNDQINYIVIYSEKPWFKDFKLAEKLRSKFHMDSMSKKVRQRIMEILGKIFGDEFTEKLSFTDFNQNGNITDNKENLNMILKDLLKNILLDNIRKKTKNNEYILTEADEKFIESLAGDDERKKYILNMKIEDIYNEFFDSKEYQDLIKDLNDDESIKDDDKYYYIHTFIEANKKFVEYYKKEKKKNNN